MTLLKVFIALVVLASTSLANVQKNVKELTFPENVKQIKIHSESMNKDIDTIVVLPENYEKIKDKRYPVIYLLHGFGGNHTSWIVKTKPDLPKIASEKNIIFVCPDGKNYWYADIPTNPEIKYETFVSKELVEYIDRTYRTIATKQARAITGFSMGGHGAVLACMKHQDTFGACGSMSGVLDLRMSVNNGKINVFGEYSKNKSLWNDNSVREQLYRLYRRDMPAMIIDCGIEDPLFRTNEKCHQDMMDMQLPHEFIVRPGKHNHAYWNNAIDTHIAFFLKHFSKK